MAKSPEAARSILVRRLSLPQEIGRSLHLYYWPVDARNDPALLEKMLPVLIDVGVLRGPLEVRKTYPALCVKDERREPPSL
jgi:hypothetical protein